MPANQKVNIMKGIITDKQIARYGPGPSKESVAKKVKARIAGMSKMDLLRLIWHAGHHDFYSDLADRQLGADWHKLPKARIVEFIIKYPEVLKLHATK